MTPIYLQNEELSDIINSFYNLLKHPFLKKFVDDPLVDEDQASLLFYMLKEKGLDSTYISQYVITTLLVQAALDTHDNVCEQNLADDEAKKKRQLTVLAGDYYSSLYYFLLSQINDVSLIRVLAKSIQAINESKMNVYKNNVKHVQATNDDVRIIDSSLLQNVAELFHAPDWKELTSEFFFFKRLVKERYTWLTTGAKGSLTKMIVKELSSENKFLNQDDYLLERFQRDIDFSKNKILQYHLEWEDVGQYLQSRVNELLKEYQYDEQRVMEEG